MILIGNQRGGARDLAAHLMKEENDHVELYALRGFACEDLRGALMESEALAKATRCRQHLFSMSFNPPPEAQVSTADFEAAIDEAEDRLGLTDQPRAIVFHEKEGRRHAHVVWSRIDADQLKAVPLPFTKKTMRGLARDLFREHGWRMPQGLADPSLRDPTNFTLEDWQQAKRNQRDPRAIKDAIQDAWAISDSGAGFAHALKERGLALARGDRRGFVAVDRHGEVYSVPRQLGCRTRDVAERLGDPADLLSVPQAQARMADAMLAAASDLHADVERQRQAHRAQFVFAKRYLVDRQRAERRALAHAIELRRIAETKARQARFRSGLAGVWDFLRGARARIRQRNEQEAVACDARDRSEKDRLIHQQLKERQRFTQHWRDHQRRAAEAAQELTQDMERFEDLRVKAKEAFENATPQSKRSRDRHGPNRGREPEP